MSEQDERPIETHTFQEGGEERTIKGWQLSSVRVDDDTIHAYFVIEDDDDSGNYLLTISTHEQWVRRDYEEYHFLSFYGVVLTNRLVWSAEWQPAKNERIRRWFRSYERWGCH